MPHWTNRHTIPGVSNPDTIVRSTILEAKIWTLCELRIDDCFQTRLLVFDPESEVFTEIDSINPSVWTSKLQNFTSDETYLYMWRAPEEGNGRDFELYKFNGVTLEWEYIMTIHRAGGFASVIISNQVMYAFGIDDESDGISLITIDLEKKEVTNVQRLQYLKDAWTGFLSTHKNSLYLIENDDDCIQKVSKVKNGRLIEIAREKMNYDRISNVHCPDSNDCLTYTRDYRKFVVRSFDFESRKWESEDIPPAWAMIFVTSGVQSAVKVNGSLYILIRTYYNRENQFELRQLDFRPKLTFICMADLTNRLAEEADTRKLGEMKKQLPIQMRAKLDELMKWTNKANQ